MKRIFLFFLITLSLTSCSRHHSKPLQGYIEGEFIYVSSNVSGKLLAMNVIRGQEVNANDILFKLDPQPEADELNASQASIQQLEAEVDFAKIQMIRQQKLLKGNATDRSSVDRAQTDFTSKTQQLNNMIAQTNKYEWTLQQKTVYSPMAAQVSDVYFRLGENVPLNQPVLSLLAPRYIRVLFYLPENLLSEIKIGDRISFSCDGCAPSTHAVIRYISPEAEYTPPIIYSQSTRNKLVYLVRAEMPEEVAKKFHPGQPLDIYLHE